MSEFSVTDFRARLRGPAGAAGCGWPAAPEWSLDEAARALGCEESWRAAVSATELLEARSLATPAPVVGVLGSLNGGKSTLVSSFLSPPGAARVPRGLRGGEATHRFVFWLPSSWQGADGAREVFLQQLAAVFGPAPILLDEDPRRAAAQYNGRDGGELGVPLLAFDPALDLRGVALLDCPDVQSSHQGETSAERLAFLGRAARLCSGFVFILDATQPRSEALSQLAKTLRSELSTRRGFLLVNRVRPSMGVTWLHGEAPLRERCEELGLGDLYAAFDHDMTGAAAVVPAAAARSAGLDPAQPVFFEVAREDALNEADAVGAERLLFTRLQALEPSQLWREALLDGQRQAVRAMDLLDEALRRATEARRAELLHLHAGLVSFVQRQAAPEGTLAIPFTPEVTRQLAESILRTAPPFAKPLLWVNRGLQHTSQRVKAARDAAAGLLRGLSRPGEGVPDLVQALRERFREERGRETSARWLDAERLARLFRRERFVPAEISPDSLIEAWSRVLDAADAGLRDLPRESLDERTRALWAAVPWWRKAVLAASGPVLLAGALLTLCLAMLDGGATSILFGVSVKEALLALGLGGAGAAATLSQGAALDDWLRQQVALPVCAGLVAGACDVFGLPRRPGGPVTMNFANLGVVTLDVDRLSCLDTICPLAPPPVRHNPP